MSSSVISSKPISCQDIVARFPELFIEVIGDASLTISGVSCAEISQPGTAVFLGNPKAVRSGLNGSASVLITSPANRSQVEPHRGSRTVLIAKNVELAMASVLSAFFLKTPYTNRSVQGIHSSAYISPLAQIGAGVRIGPHVFIGDHVILGDGTYIGASSVIEDDSEIGEGTVIHPQVFIGHSTKIGRWCEIHPSSVIGKEGFGYAHDEKGNHYRIPHSGRVVLEDRVHVGAACTIDRGTFGNTVLSAGTILDNHVHIGHNGQIGRNSVITAGFLLAGSTKIGANFLTGGHSVVTGHIEVCDNVQLAALSAVSKSITKPGQYGGNPLQPLQQFVKTKVAMTKLPEMQKQIKRMLKHLGIETESSSKSEDA